MTLDPNNGVVWGAFAYLLFAIGSRRLIARHQRRGMTLVKQERYADAISEFQASLAFFDRYPWIDRFRCVTMMSASAMSYREMALLNIAFCQSQQGNGRRARESYEACLARFPDSVLAHSALRLMEAAKNAS
jgi:tetratricopeptide (TPR) repeat protein